jgi:hypothetical protein
MLGKIFIRGRVVPCKGKDKTKLCEIELFSIDNNIDPS